MNQINLRNHRGKFYADKIADGELLRKVIGKSSFSLAEYDEILKSAGMWGITLCVPQGNVGPLAGRDMSAN